MWDSKKLLEILTPMMELKINEILKICESYLYDTAMKSEINDKKEVQRNFRYNVLC